ncbi:hypothetical protein [Paraburkholderia kururiensis]|uniref:Uncharacterized protein n=1 Tax=Paraburkholderia kururiensis TaxID=984307 RepID=A0ABZ0WSV6_9BURK|nr:hypothetical protein [Paraburkholderia kururiensis]WQD80477.1 hypothetical protein U0042_12785 [Paraburkholderia kururiensis]
MTTSAMENAAEMAAAARCNFAPRPPRSLPPYCPAFLFVINILPFYGRRPLMKFAQCDCGEIRKRPRASGMLLFVNPGLRNSCIFTGNSPLRAFSPMCRQCPRRAPRQAFAASPYRIAPRACSVLRVDSNRTTTAKNFLQASNFVS